MASKSAFAKGALALLIMHVCMETIVVMAAKPRLLHVASESQPQLPAVEAVSDAVLMVEQFVPCLEALKGVEGCGVELWKAVFRLPLDAKCCQAVNQIAKTCLPKGFALPQALLPAALKNCINAPASPPASS